MAQKASENEWGTLAFLFGAIALAGIYLDNKHLRRVGMLMVFMFRFFSLILIGIQNNFANTGTGDLTLWSLMAAYAYYRIDNEF